MGLISVGTPKESELPSSLPRPWPYEFIFAFTGEAGFTPSSYRPVVDILFSSLLVCGSLFSDFFVVLFDLLFQC